MRDEVYHAVTSMTPREPGWLTPSIQKSHERSEIFGLSASMRPDYDVLPAAELALKLEQSRVLCAHATPVMESLHEQIVNTQSMIVLTDSQGLILHSIGDDDFLRRAEKVALRPGLKTGRVPTRLARRSPSNARQSCMVSSIIWPPIAF
jgi:transcriptional regulator of acetoin/glycerol metabolism